MDMPVGFKIRLIATPIVCHERVLTLCVFGEKLNMDTAHDCVVWYPAL